MGNITDLMFMRQHIVEQFDDLYYKFPEERFVGRYEFTRPMLLLRDLDLIKKITVKDFEYFIDHRSLMDEVMEPLIGRNLFSLSSEEWKDMRATLSPAFTSAKMRSMVPFMLDASNTMMQTLKDKIKLSGADYVDVESRDIVTQYTIDVIASCAFGLKVNSHKENDNEFYTAGSEIVSVTLRKMLIGISHTLFPKFSKYFGLQLLSKKTSDFFRRIILDTMKERESKNIMRPDMIHLLMEAKKGKLAYDEKQNESDASFAAVEESHVGRKHVNRDWSNDDLVAQAVLFFIAGNDTVSTAMTFLLYELAINPDVQERLVQEIKEHNIKTGSKFDFTSVQNIKYLDMVVSEVLRLWPPAVGTDRQCAKDYNMGKPNSTCTQDYIIRKGEAVIIPVYAIHRNPEFFPDPLKFNPERFSDENKHKIKPLTYIPFGIGPRNCIGSRFALFELKVMIYNLLQQFVVSPCEKTPIPVKLLKGSFNLKIEGGHWLRFTVRK